MSLFTAWGVNHPILLSKEGIREHIETILLINGTSLNHYVEYLFLETYEAVRKVSSHQSRALEGKRN